MVLVFTKIKGYLDCCSFDVGGSSFPFAFVLALFEVDLTATLAELEPIQTPGLAMLIPIPGVLKITFVCLFVPCAKKCTKNADGFL